MIREKETRFEPDFKQLCRSNLGWYSDKSICDDHLIKEWELSQKVGVYVLWHKDDYCAEHERFHMRALYVGKGKVECRLLQHWKHKDFSQEQLVYWSFYEMPNRQAKYYEQLLLDLYSFPFNKSENVGNSLVCSHLSQEEVD